MEYIEVLEEERKKILVFERELPLSLQLVTQAIETYKKQHVVIGEDIVNSKGPVLEEFIPLRPSCSSYNEENNSNNENENFKVNCGINGDGDEKKKKKPDWLQSAQLWNQQPEQFKGDAVKKPVSMNAKRITGAFHPFEREKIVNVAPTSSTSNDNTNGGCGNGGSRDEKEKEKEGHSQRKARRWWSTELHQRFLYALQVLGGPHVATPKQIRELMNVDGLTNDEVKSHLQKYRLHNKRPTASPAVEASSQQQPPQIVLVGGIWVPPPPEYATGTPLKAVPCLPSQVSPQQIQHQSKRKTNRPPTTALNSERRRRDEDNKSVNAGEGMNSDSSDTSSSNSQTTTASPQ